jgi:hypothetical protein
MQVDMDFQQHFLKQGFTHPLSTPVFGLARCCTGYFLVAVFMTPINHVLIFISSIAAPTEAKQESAIDNLLI